MKSKLLLLLSIIPLLLIVPNLVYGDEFYVETDKSEYYFNELIIISGEVEEPPNFNSNITIIGLNPNESIVTINQITPNEDKTFNIEIYISEIYDYGTYTVTANYLNDSTETTFEIIEGWFVNVQTDQSQYSYGDTVYIDGAIPQLGNSTDVTISVINPNGDTAYTDIINIEDLTFEMNFDVEGALYNEIGTYTITAEYEEYTASTTFETISSNLTIQTDQDVYYMDSVISVSGTMVQYDNMGDTSLIVDFYDEDGDRIEMWEYPNRINDDGSFNLTINTIDTDRWEYTGGVTLFITIQNNTSSTQFDYINTADMTNESNYNRILDIYRMLANITDDENIDQDVTVDIKERNVQLEARVAELESYIEEILADIIDIQLGDGEHDPRCDPYPCE